MGRVVREEYVCDFCGEAIGDARAFVGHLSLRRIGARGLGRDFDVALHDTCSEKLTRFAPPAARRQKRMQKT
jgi:hypothetical protein